MVCFCYGNGDKGGGHICLSFCMIHQTHAIKQYIHYSVIIQINRQYLATILGTSLDLNQYTGSGFSKHKYSSKIIIYFCDKKSIYCRQNPYYGFTSTLFTLKIFSYFSSWVTHAVAHFSVIHDLVCHHGECFNIIWLIVLKITPFKKYILNIGCVFVMDC